MTHRVDGHDVIEVRVVDSGCVLVCRCGRVFDGHDRADVETRHAGHFGVEQSRAALREAAQDA